MVENVVYKATVTKDNNETDTYTGLTSQTFKNRWYKHQETKNDENHPVHAHLGSEIKNFDIKWTIIDKVKDFNPITRKCRLCMKEKFHILYNKSGATLNERSELFSTCRH